MDTNPGFPVDTENLTDPQIHRPKKSRKIFIIIFGVILFFVFLIFKLPEAKIQNFVMAHIRIITQNHGLSFNASSIKVGFFPFGPSVKIIDAEIKSLEDEKQMLKIDTLRIKPGLLSVIFFKSDKFSASISAELLNGQITGQVSAATLTSGIDMTAFFELDNLSLSKATLLQKFAFIQLNGLINGKIKLSLNTARINESSGEINLSAQKLVLPTQTVMGINIPSISVSESKIGAEINGGKLQFKNITIGKNAQKDTPPDDIVAIVTGDLALNARLDRSVLNSKVVFSLSNRLLQSFPFLNALLGAGKGTDDKFTFKITGPLTALEPKAGG